MWLAEYDVDVYNAPEVFSVPPLTRLILPVMSGHQRVYGGQRHRVRDYTQKYRSFLSGKGYQRRLFIALR